MILAGILSICPRLSYVSSISQQQAIANHFDYLFSLPICLAKAALVLIQLSLFMCAKYERQGKTFPHLGHPFDFFCCSAAYFLLYSFLYLPVRYLFTQYSFPICLRICYPQSFCKSFLDLKQPYSNTLIQTFYLPSLNNSVDDICFYVQYFKCLLNAYQCYRNMISGDFGVDPIQIRPDLDIREQTIPLKYYIQGMFTYMLFFGQLLYYYERGFKQKHKYLNEKKKNLFLFCLEKNSFVSISQQPIFSLENLASIFNSKVYVSLFSLVNDKSQQKQANTQKQSNDILICLKFHGATSMEQPTASAFNQLKIDNLQEDNCKLQRKEEEPQQSSARSHNAKSSDPISHDDYSDERSSSEAYTNSSEVKKQEEEDEQNHRGNRPANKNKQEPKRQKTNKTTKKKKKQKRQMRESEIDDPCNRGIPKSKKIHKRKNKPKVISEEAKLEAQIKRQEEEYQRKIMNRGKKPVVKKLRGEKKNAGKKKDNQEVKIQAIAIKFEENQDEDSEDSEGSKIKPRTSRKQRQQQRDEDRRKVDKLMVKKHQRQRREYLQSVVRMQRMMAVKFGAKMSIQIDPSCKYYSQYKCRKDQIQKSGKLYCQIYNKHSVPSTGRHFFQMKIARISFQSVAVGLITAHNFQQQYSRDKTHCICFDAYTHSTYVQGVKTDLQVEVKLNDIIRTVVDIPKSIVHWYVNNDFISEAIIPPHLAELPLYPYLQVSNKWIKLRINDFQQ